jgi:hypothetical protein
MLRWDLSSSNPNAPILSMLQEVVQDGSDFASPARLDQASRNLDEEDEQDEDEDEEDEEEDEDEGADEEEDDVEELDKDNFDDDFDDDFDQDDPDEEQEGHDQEFA